MSCHLPASCSMVDPPGLCTTSTATPPQPAPFFSDRDVPCLVVPALQPLHQRGTTSPVKKDAASRDAGRQPPTLPACTRIRFLPLAWSLWASSCCLRLPAAHSSASWHPQQAQNGCRQPLFSELSPLKDPPQRLCAVAAATTVVPSTFFVLDQRVGALC